MGIDRIAGGVAIGAALLAIGGGPAPAAPVPNLNPNKAYVCAIPASAGCRQLDPKWQFIKSIDVDYSFTTAFNGFVYTANPKPGITCDYKIRQHLDLHPGTDLGFYDFTGSAGDMAAAPPGTIPSSKTPVSFTRSVHAHLTDPKYLGKLAGTGMVGVENVVEASGFTKDNETCVVEPGAGSTFSGTITVHYLEGVKPLYDPRNPPTVPKNPKLPKPKF